MELKVHILGSLNSSGSLKMNDIFRSTLPCMKRHVKFNIVPKFTLFMKDSNMIELILNFHKLS